MLMVGSFPFNSFLSGLFCHLGLFALGSKFDFLLPYGRVNLSSCLLFIVSLRLQISSSDFATIPPEKAFGDFAFSVIVMFLVVFSFLG